MLLQCVHGGPFRQKKPISQRKNLLIQFVHGHQPARCPNRVLCVHQPSAVPSVGGFFVVAGCVCAVCWRWWCDVMWCGMMSCGWLRGEMKQCGSLWSDVRGGKVVRCEMSRHIMPRDVTSCDGDLSCLVMWRCKGMGCYAAVMRCGCAMWLAVKSCYVMQSGCVLWWIGRWCAVNYGEPMSQHYDSVLQSAKVVLLRTTPVLLQYYSVLQSTTPHCKVLYSVSTSKYYSSTQKCGSPFGLDHRHGSLERQLSSKITFDQLRQFAA